MRGTCSPHDKPLRNPGSSFRNICSSTTRRKTGIFRMRSRFRAELCIFLSGLSRNWPTMRRARGPRWISRCAVGRSTFELARFAQSVIGVDCSAAFISAAETLRCDGRHSCEILVEGERTAEFTARIPGGIDVSRISFETGDASALRADIGRFDLVLAANLLCRLPDPGKFLCTLPDLVAPGGQLILATPFSWLPESHLIPGTGSAGDQAPGHRGTRFAVHSNLISIYN